MRRLSDEEIEEKFSVSQGTPEFDVARRLSDSRIDRTINEMPNVTCPACGHASEKLLWQGVRVGWRWRCLNCKRHQYVVHVEVTTTVTLQTEPEPS